jgi:hypothetical protein
VVETKRSVSRSGRSSAAAEEEVLDLLRSHNRRVAPPATYEPARNSVRDVRAWERASGKVWSKLSVAERAAANAEMGRPRTGGR